ncbi:RidA family protein [Microvirga rosea]|uniref:RidA family protein n=1 Tax=Microvirga rosea TaxID=2715425 RepID=UPI001D0ABDE3|nr:RidA family protein [Microvirga rosea]MCB8822577.1 RidA family protein [Microvirga rosea]
MTFASIQTPHVTAPRGPYSQACKAGDFIFVSGQLPFDRQGNIVGPNDIRLQTKAVLANLSAILEAAGSSLAKVVKTTVFLTSLDDFGIMNEVYSEVFTPPYPARSTVEISRLPAGILLEIDCIALA